MAAKITVHKNFQGRTDYVTLEGDPNHPHLAPVVSVLRRSGLKDAPLTIESPPSRDGLVWDRDEMGALRDFINELLAE